MRRLALIVLLVGVSSCVGSLALAVVTDGFEIITRRGNSNGDTVLDVSDVAHIVNFVFNGGAAPPCLDAADVNDDGGIDQSDAVYLSNWLLLGGSAPPAPGPFACGADPTPDALGCELLACP